MRANYLTAKLLKNLALGAIKIKEDNLIWKLTRTPTVKHPPPRLLL
jgi:hypothetical protein